MFGASFQPGTYFHNRFVRFVDTLGPLPASECAGTEPVVETRRFQFVPVCSQAPRKELDQEGWSK